MAKLTEDEIAAVLTAYPDWRLEGQALVRDLVFDDFAQAMDFVNRVAALAEDRNHHPDITIRYNKVQLALVSHDVGGITSRDARMAAKLQELPSRV